MMSALLVMMLGGSDGSDPFSAAVSLANKCDFQAALGQIDTAPKFQRDSLPVKFARARILIQLDRGSESVRELTGMPPQASFYGEGEFYLVLALAHATANSFREAEKALQKARTAGADRDLVDSTAARLQLQAGRLVDAEVAFRDLLSRADAKSLTGAIYNLAVLHAAKGRLFESASLIRLAWHLGYRNPQKLRSDRDLAVVLKSGLLDDLAADFASARCVTW